MTKFRGHAFRRISTSLSRHADKYSSTVILPTTHFPLKDDFAHRDQLLAQRCTDNLYQWQIKRTHLPTYILQDGPPYANGPLHMGHALNKILKDIICRYKLLKGHRVVYIPGWDCHGLPIEMKALSSMKSSEQKSLSPKQIRSLARTVAKNAVDLQKYGFDHLTIMADWKNPYYTYDNKYEIRQLQVFKNLVSKGSIFRSRKPVAYSPSSRTALAEAELLYFDIVSQSVYVHFPVTDLSDCNDDSFRNILHGASFLIWTTTPWTLPANMAVMVNPDMEYVVIKSEKLPSPMVIALSRIPHVKSLLDTDDIEISKHFPGSSLLNCKYTHPFSHSASAKYPVLASHHVTSTSGTGVVHSAPAHGSEDFEIYTRTFPEQIKKLAVFVDDVGKYTSKVPAYPEKLAGLPVLGKGTEAVLEILNNINALVKKENYTHSYPHDWRTRKPIIILATEQWFADIKMIKDHALAAVSLTNFHPPAGQRRLQSHIQDRSEWCISRQRVWGVPIPALYVKRNATEVGKEEEQPEALLTVESIEHIISVLSDKGIDHWFNGPVEDFIPSPLRDSLKRDNATVTKGNDTMDVWFDSGVAWTDTREREQNDVQADVYLEGLDQHRGWFQSSLLTYVASSNHIGQTTAPFKNVITHGFVLDAKGDKMSKSLNNVIDPIKLIKDEKNNGCGRDNLRHWVASVDYTHDVPMSKDIMDKVKNSTKKLRSVARFMLGNLESGSSALRNDFNLDHLSFVDQYVLHELHTLVQKAENSYDTFQFSKVTSALQDFTTNTLSAFYFEIAKDTLYCDSLSSIRRLGTVFTFRKTLDAITGIMAPVLPHLAEEIYEHDTTRHFIEKGKEDSVFKHRWPSALAEFENWEVKKHMDLLFEIRPKVMILSERARADKHIGRSVEARLVISPKSQEMQNLLHEKHEYLSSIFSVSEVEISSSSTIEMDSKKWRYDCEQEDLNLVLLPAKLSRCNRCRLHAVVKDKKIIDNGHDDSSVLCERCTKVVECN